MNNRIVIIALAILVVVGLLALYAGNNLPATAPTPTVEAPATPTPPTPPPAATPETPPATEPTPTTPAP